MACSTKGQGPRGSARVTGQGVQGLDFRLVTNARTAVQRESHGLLDVELGIRVRPAQDEAGSARV